MNSRHLTKGDACPPLVDGKLRIYSMRFCPYAQRALLVADAKKIPYDIVNVNLTEKPEFIFGKNPGGKVPTIETPRGSLYESLIVCDFIDEVYPESGSGGDAPADDTRLNPIDPFKKALDRILVETFSKVSTLDYKTFYAAAGLGEEETLKLLTELFDALIPFEQELVRRGTKFFRGSERPGMLDYMIWPWMERLPTHELLFKDKFDFAAVKATTPHLNAWVEEMKKDPAVLNSFITPEVHMEYRLARKEGVSKYDLLLGK